jgi:hypothetical protein
MTLAYRGVDQIAESRFAAIREKLASDQIGLAPLLRVCARRQGRIVGGAVAVALGLLGFLLALVPLEANEAWFDHTASAAATYTFLFAWPVAAVALCAAGVAAWHINERRIETSVRETGDPLADLARAERLDPVRQLVSKAKGLERLSVALPLAGVAFLAPLTIHFAVSVFIAASNHGESATDFAMWIRWSAVLVGHAHVVLAICGFRFARRLAERDTAVIAKGTAHDGLVAVGWTTLAALVPGAILFLVPPALVLFTGLAFAPLAYSMMGRRIYAERLVLEGAEKA